MWGNRLGWGISALIVMVAGLLVYQLHALSQPTPTTGELVALVTGHPVPLEPLCRPLLPPVKADGDAGDLYRQAIDDLHERQKQDPDPYATLTDTKDYDPAAIAQLKGLDDLVAAAELPTMNFYRSKPELIVNYDKTVPSLDDLETLGKAAAKAGTLAALDGKYDDARKYAGAAVALGLHLYQERVAYDELSDGISILGDGLAVLKYADDKAGDKPAADAVAAADKARRDEYDQDVKAWKIISGLNEAEIARYAGDFFQLAADAKVDPVWRAEAARRLGRLKLNPPRLADAVRATKVAREMAADRSLPPSVHVAADAASHITSKENQSGR